MNGKYIFLPVYTFEIHLIQVQVTVNINREIPKMASQYLHASSRLCACAGMQLIQHFRGIRLINAANSASFQFLSRLETECDAMETR